MKQVWHDLCAQGMGFGKRFRSELKNQNEMRCGPRWETIEEPLVGDVGASGQSIVGEELDLWHPVASALSRLVIPLRLHGVI
eukprot:762850-Hanusia_phi.AAC.2